MICIISIVDLEKTIRSVTLRLYKPFVKTAEEIILKSTQLSKYRDGVAHTATQHMHIMYNT